MKNINMAMTRLRARKWQKTAGGKTALLEEMNGCVIVGNYKNTHHGVHQYTVAVFKGEFCWHESNSVDRSRTFSAAEIYQMFAKALTKLR